MTQFLVEAQRAGQLDADLRLLIEVVARTAKALAVMIGKGQFADVHGEAGSHNVQGEVQKKLDVVANELLLQANAWGGHLAAMASEEEETICLIPEGVPRGGYLLLFDPLDGSSNIDVNISVGTIFSVLRNVEAGQEGPRGRDYNMRWVGSMVADVHRILTRGGIFLYPVDRKTANKGGKLRLMYEANPMAFLVEQAGGMATDGAQRLLDLVPQTLHQRVGVVLGAKREVALVQQYHQKMQG